MRVSNKTLAHLNVKAIRAFNSGYSSCSGAGASLESVLYKGMPLQHAVILRSFLGDLEMKADRGEPLPEGASLELRNACQIVKKKEVKK